MLVKPIFLYQNITSEHLSLSNDKKEQKRAANHCEVSHNEAKGLDIVANCIDKTGCVFCCGILQELVAMDANTSVRNMATIPKILLC